jgi:hypothetical protein
MLGLLVKETQWQRYLRSSSMGTYYWATGRMFSQYSISRGARERGKLLARKYRAQKKAQGG